MPGSWSDARFVRRASDSQPFSGPEKGPTCDMSEAKIPFLDLSDSTRAVADQFVESTSRLVNDNQFIGGDCLHDFESSFARYCGVEHCVGLNSGTDALRLALAAAGVKDGDEVITSPFTFIASAEAISQTGHLVLADVDPATFTLSPGAVRASLSERTRALMPVHIFGVPAEMRSLKKIAGERDLFLLEDACQAHGAGIDGRRVGSWGDAAAFSFYPSKNLGAFGDAGALTCRDTDLAERVRLLRNHGQSGPYFHMLEGFNSRLDSLQAELLRLKLPHLDSWNDERRRLAHLYQDLLSGLEELTFQAVPDGFHHVYHVLAATTPRRDELMSYLQSRGISARAIYPTPIHLMPAYESLSLGEGSFPVAERICREVICLPLFPGLQDTQVERVAAAVLDFFGKR